MQNTASGSYRLPVSPGGLIRYPGERAKSSRHYVDRPLDMFPTEAPPGSEAKLAVMIERQRRGEALFHPHDCPLELDSETLDPIKVHRLWDRGPGTGHIGRQKAPTERDRVFALA